MRAVLVKYSRRRVGSIREPKLAEKTWRWGDGASQILKAQGELDERAATGVRIRRRDYFDNE